MTFHGLLPLISTTQNSIEILVYAVRCARPAYLTILDLITVTIPRRRNSSAGKVTRIRAARPRNRGSVRDSGKRLRFGSVQPALGPTDPRTQWTPSSFLGEKRSGREAVKLL